MTAAPHLTLDPFAAGHRRPDEPDDTRAAMRAAGPIVRLEAPAGGPVWIITDDAVARAALVHPDIVKDPAFAPAGWDARTAGLEPTAAQRSSLTTSDGAEHTRLRRAHAPLFSARRMQAQRETIAATARELLGALAAGEQPVDLLADFTTRYPLTVICDLLGVPRHRIDQAAAACSRVLVGYPDGFDQAMGEFAQLAAAALASGPDGLAAELRERLPAGVADDELHYHLFGLIFAGQLTTDATLGFLLARLLGGGHAAETTADLVRTTLRMHPPTPFTLWRFTRAEVELADVRLPARAPVLIDIQGINETASDANGHDLAFGAGPHYCLGAQLAELELSAVVDVLRAEFPTAHLAVPYSELVRTEPGGVMGSRLTRLPVVLRPVP